MSKTARIEALRAFMWAGERVEVGQQIEIGANDAAMLCAANKAKPAADKPAPKAKTKEPTE